MCLLGIWPPWPPNILNLPTPVQMKNERGRLAKVAYKIRKEEKMQTRIKDKGLEVYLEVRKDENDLWAKRKA